MSDHMKDIEKAIQKAAIDGALTEGAVKQFNNVVSENKVLKTNLNSSKEKVENLEATIQLLQQERDEARAIRDRYYAREEELKKREETATEFRLRREAAEQRVEDHKEMVKLIFRNPVTLSQVVTPGHPGVIDQYGNRQGQEWPQTHDVKSEDT